MTETSQLIATIKHQLKIKNLKYRDVALALKLSEPSVKRLFSSERLSVHRLAQLSQLLDFTLAELMEKSESTRLKLHTLTHCQETQIVSNEKLLLVTVCALNHWSMADIVASYRMTKAECLKNLLTLNRLGIIELLPGDRIRLRLARDFDWLPKGPLRRYFLQHGLGDFLDGKFEESDASMDFVQGMLTASARAQLQMELRRLRSKFAALHEESSGAPLHQRCGTGLLLAAREWEPVGFKQLKRSTG